MANQRMYLVCEICLAEKHISLEHCIQYLGKYYPTGGWEAESMVPGVIEFFDNHQHTTFTGKYARIAYDSELFDWAADRDRVLNIVSKSSSGAVADGEDGK